MKILFLADGRSPIALNWIGWFAAAGHTVHLASTYPCTLEIPFASVTIIPAAFGAAAGRGYGEKGGRGWLRRWIPPGLRTMIRQRWGPRTLAGAESRFRGLILRSAPDLVHAMRIPFEGMIAARSIFALGSSSPPLILSVWGNDFTLHAASTPQMAALTRQALAAAAALHTDCARDARLALEWGYDPARPRAILPGGGGVQPEVFFPPEADSPERALTVIQPRGLRAYVRNDAFFAAIPRVLEKFPAARFLCPAMEGEAAAEKWAAPAGISHAVRLLPKVSRARMADLFRAAAVAVSPSEHDGTPNTLLEAMACGCFPVAGDIEPLREWITPGENGLLADPADPEALAAAICRALADAPLRARAADLNRALIAARAVYPVVMRAAEEFYARVIGG